MFNADAIWGVINIDYIRYAWFNDFVSSQVWLMRFLSRSAYVLQLLAPFLIVFPSKSMLPLVGRIYFVVDACRLFAGFEVRFIPLDKCFFVGSSTASVCLFMVSEKW